MKYEDLHEEAKQDLKFDIDLLEKESLDIPKLHTKWFDYYMREKSIMHKISYEVAGIYKEKYEFYMGIGNGVVNAKQALSQNVKYYIDSDSEYQAVQKKYDIQKLKVEYIEGVIKMIGNRGFQIKSAVDFIRFKHGS